MIDIYAVHIKNKLDKVIFYNLMSFVSQEKRERIIRFHKIEDAQRTLVADILLRYIIFRRLGIRNKDIFFCRNEFGKPFLKHFNNFHFNISHACEWVVCAAYNMPVGVDIEYMQPVDIDIAKRFYSMPEYNDLLNMDDSDRLPYFYDLWTLKESYIKAAGKGLSIPLDSFSFRNAGDNIMFETKNELSECYFKRFNIDSRYKMAVCGLADDFPCNVKVLGLSEIIEPALFA